MKLQDTILKSFRNKAYTLAVFLDIEKAFDMLWHPALLHRLHQIGVVGNLMEFIRSFLSDRSIQVRVGNTLSDHYHLENGVPQGSVLSPTLFLILMDQMKIKNPSVELSLFADDSAAYQSGKDLNKLASDIQKALDDIIEFCDSVGFKISATKSCAIVFTKKYKNLTPDEPLMIQGTELRIATETKFLGLKFDYRLTWTEHINYIIDKCKKRLNILKCLSSTRWGATKETMITLYKALIRSHLDYGSIAFDSTSKTNKNKLDSIQYQALKLCAGAMTSTSLLSLQQDCGEPPLDIRRLKANLSYAYKIQSNPNHPTKDILQNRITNDPAQTSTTLLFSDRIKDFMQQNQGIQINVNNTIKLPPWTQSGITTDISLSHIISKKDNAFDASTKTLVLAKINDYHDYFHTYTDGSKDINNRVGCAAYLPELHHAITLRLTDNITVFASELVAIYIAIKYVANNCNLNNFNNNRKIVIFSDSLSSIQAIESRASKSRPKLLNNIFNLVHKLGKNIVIVWVPGHTDTKGNEVADKAAKEATTHTNIDFNCGFEHTETREIINDYVLKKWQVVWETDVRGSFYKQIETNVSFKVKFKNKNRKIEVIGTRLRLGKCRLNYYLNKINCHPTGLCDSCRVNETIQHYLLECPDSGISAKLIDICKLKQIPFTLEDILRNENILLQIIPFIEKIL